MFDGFEEVKATWWQATCVWWLIVWRASVIILVLGAIAGAAFYYAVTVRGVQFDIPRLVAEGALYSCILVPLVLLIVVRISIAPSLVSWERQRCAQANDAGDPRSMKRS
jgi:hypothetical protein